MAGTCGLDFERQLGSPAFEVRRVISEALRELGFQIVVDQMTRIEGKRGGMLGYSLMMKKQLPVLAVFDLSPGGSGCAVVAHLSDNIKNVGKSWGFNRQFHELFEEVRGRVDAGLAALDPSSAPQFAQARFWSRSGDIGFLEQGTQLGSKAMGGAIGTAARVLDRPKDHTPGIWKGVDSVTFASAAGEAVLSLAEAQAILGVAVMIASHPGSMPPNLLRDVEAFAALVEQCLTAAGGSAARVEVSDAHKPVFEFLNQQSQIRASLPMRQLYVCRSCRLEKIVNPDFKRLQSRNEKINDIFAGVTATVGKGGISPTFVLGQVFKMKKLDPDFVCSRCQGMEADERVITFCPQCADLQRDVVLRLCSKCKFDFRTKASKEPVWAVPVLQAELAVVPDAAEAPAAAAAEAAFEAEVAAIVPESAESGEETSPQPEPTPEPITPTNPDTPRGPGFEPVAPAPVAPVAPAAPAPAPASARPVPAPAPAPLPAPAAPAPAPVWQAPVSPPAGPARWSHPALVPLGAPQIGPHGGKVCSRCGREHVVLWRVVVAEAGGYRELFLCGTTPTCQAPSVVVATQV